MAKKLCNEAGKIKNYIGKALEINISKIDF